MTKHYRYLYLDNVLRITPKNTVVDRGELDSLVIELLNQNGGTFHETPAEVLVALNASFRVFLGNERHEDYENLDAALRRAAELLLSDRRRHKLYQDRLVEMTQAVGKMADFPTPNSPS